MLRNRIILYSLLSFQLVYGLPSMAQNAPSYNNRIGLNVLGLPADNLVLTYEHSFSNNGIWVGLEHRLNQLSDEKDQQVNSFALEYRYYLFAKEKIANGPFAGLFTKYRWGDEKTTIGDMVQHQYEAVFAGLNTGYRYNYKRLALSAFLGYGWALWSSESSQPVHVAHNLNENYLEDFRIGLTVGLAF